jgi:L-threonylcarbamoyladenylate synthase
MSTHQPTPTIPEKTIQKGITILKKGGIVVFPTDTAYGLGGIYDNPEVIQRILAVKHRTDDRFTVVAASVEQAQHFFPDLLRGKARALAQQYWPGPLSIAVNEHYSVRVPDQAITRALAEGVGKPLIATSANLRGNETPYTIDDAQRELGVENVDLWIDIGPLPERPTSTIIAIVDDRIHIIRKGAIDIVSP